MQLKCHFNILNDKDKSYKYNFSIKSTRTLPENKNKNETNLFNVRILPEHLRNNKQVVMKALDSISNTLKDDIDVARKINLKKINLKRTHKLFNESHCSI